jgi:hypothetical protein
MNPASWPDRLGATVSGAITSGRETNSILALMKNLI